MSNQDAVLGRMYAGPHQMDCCMATFKCYPPVYLRQPPSGRPQSCRAAKLSSAATSGFGCEQVCFSRHRAAHAYEIFLVCAIITRGVLRHLAVPLSVLPCAAHAASPSPACRTGCSCLLVSAHPFILLQVSCGQEFIDRPGRTNEDPGIAAVVSAVAE